MVEQWPLVLAATIGVCIGTVIGSRVLPRIERTTFRRIVAVLLFALGIYMLAAGGT
jgi:uncharacterized membrane protein YfcA